MALERIAVRPDAYEVSLAERLGTTEIDAADVDLEAAAPSAAPVEKPATVDVAALLKAGMDGEAAAFKELARIFAEGDGVAQSTERSLNFLKKAGELGDIGARAEWSRLVLANSAVSSKDKDQAMIWRNTAGSTSQKQSGSASPSGDFSSVLMDTVAGSAITTLTNMGTPYTIFVCDGYQGDRLVLSGVIMAGYDTSEKGETDACNAWANLTHGALRAEGQSTIRDDIYGGELQVEDLSGNGQRLGYYHLTDKNNAVYYGVFSSPVKNLPNVGQKAYGGKVGYATMRQWGGEFAQIDLANSVVQFSGSYVDSVGTRVRINSAPIQVNRDNGYFYGVVTQSILYNQGIRETLTYDVVGVIGGEEAHNIAAIILSAHSEWLPPNIEVLIGRATQ